MRRASVLLASLLYAGTCATAQVDRVGVDPRVELFSLIFRLSGATEYQQARVPLYSQAADAWFAPYRNHEAVQYARQLWQSNSISYDAPMNLAIHVTDAVELRERVPFDTPGSTLDRRWTPPTARRFLTLARDFVAASHFTEFLDSQKAFIETTNSRHNALVASMDITWFGRFFGFTAPVRYEVVSGLLTGSSSYGPSLLAEDGVLEVYAIQGIPSVDAGGFPTLPAGYLSNLVHELTHSYANPLVDQFMDTLDAAGRRLYSAAQAEMSGQGYGNATSVLYETLVRACSARYTREHNGDSAGASAVDYERSRGFVWIDQVYQALAEYESDRAGYPTLTDYMPRLASLLDDASYRAPALMAAYEANRPQVANTTPANGEQVPSATVEIAFVFDKPMKSAASLSLGAGSAPARLSQARWDETGTIFRLACVLEPGKEYAIALTSFMSADGYALKPYTLRFRTAE